jgi:outer membrane receptor protein involved in Fe transport
LNANALASANLEDDPAVQSRLRGISDFDEEFLDNLELGWKASHVDDSLHTRLAIFYMDRSDQQVKGSVVIPLADGGSSFLDFTDNAAEGTNYGLEMELDWLATEDLRLYANLGLLRTEFDSYTNAFGEDLSGREQAHAPEYQYSMGGRYSFGDGYFVNLSAEGKDGYLFSDRHDAAALSYRLFNARMGYLAARWELSVWVNNLTNEDYYVRGFGSFGNDPRNGYTTEPYYQLGTPRVSGVSATLSL